MKPSETDFDALLMLSQLQDLHQNPVDTKAAEFHSATKCPFELGIKKVSGQLHMSSGSIVQQLCNCFLSDAVWSEQVATCQFFLQRRAPSHTYAPSAL